MAGKYIDHLVPINNVCNQKCNFCSAEYRMEGNPEIPLKEIFSQIQKKGDYIQISGGEPLLNPKIFTILYFIRKYKKNCFIELQTNGVYLLTAKKLDKLQKFNIDLYNINYPSHITKINDAIAGTLYTKEIREKSMHEVIARELPLRINIIVNTLNVTTLKETIEYIAKEFVGVERIQLSFTKAMGAADKNGEVVPEYEYAEKYMIGALRVCEKNNIKVDVDHIPMCFLGKYYTTHVDYHKKQRGEIGVFLEEKTYITKCNSCKLQTKCTGYRKDYLEIYNQI